MEDSSWEAILEEHQQQDAQYQLFQEQHHSILQYATFSDEQRNFRENFVPTLVSNPINGSKSVDREDGNNSYSPNRSKGHHQRHTEYQIQRLEAYFQEFPYPNETQKRDLSIELGLEPAQIKFWFQNKRSLMKNQKERMDNQRLREENDKLIAKNIQLKEALSKALFCPNCSNPQVSGRASSGEHPLRIENAFLHEEIERMTNAAKYSAQNMTSYQNLWPAGSSFAPNEFGL